jgi:aryl carrier-like protein
MYCCINDEVIHSEAALVPVGVDLVRVLHLVREHLMQLASLEFHLLLAKLVF